MIDIISVPERFKNSIGESCNEYILNGFFSEVVIDPVDLLFRETSADIFIQLKR